MTTEPDVTGEATPERIAKAGTETAVDSFGRRTFTDDPVTRLAAKGGLYPDKTINMKLLDAAKKYYSDWYTSNMSVLASFDPTRVYAGGGGESSPGMPVSQMQAVCRDAFRKAKAAVGKKYLQVVDAVVLHEQGDYVAIGRKACGLASVDACRAVATERLTAGLYVMAKHYGFIK